MNDFKKVTEQEFSEFVRNYPTPLDYDVCFVPVPPLGSHNDFSGGKVWPESMVTRVNLHSKGKYDYYIKKGKYARGLDAKEVV